MFLIFLILIIFFACVSATVLPNYQVNLDFISLEMGKKFNSSIGQLKSLKMDLSRINGPLKFEALGVVPSIDRCESLPLVPDPTVFCSGVVDYSFLVPGGMMQDDLNNQAIAAALSYADVTKQPNSCQSAIKRSVCAETYRSCVSDDGIGSVVISRPCLTICEAVDVSCSPIPRETFGIMCDKADPHNSTATLFVDADSDSQCNGLGSTDGIDVVAHTSEAYIGASCVESLGAYDIFIPEAPLLDAYFAPMAPPYLVQMILEGIVVQQIASIPRFLSPDCMSASVRLLCGSVFIRSHSFDVIPGFVSIDLPSYPHRNVCRDVEKSCFQPAGCDATVPMTTIEMFPKGDQVIGTLDMALFGSPNTTLDLVAPPNNDLALPPVAEPQCPRHLVRYDKIASTTVALPGTACAIPAESEGCDNMAVLQVPEIFAFIFITIAAMNMYLTPAKKRPAIHFIASVGISWSYLFILMILFMGVPMEKWVDPATPYDFFTDLGVPSMSLGLFGEIRLSVMNALYKATAMELYMRVVMEEKRALYIAIPCCVVAVYVFTVRWALFSAYSESMVIFTCPNVPVNQFVILNDDWLELSDNLSFWPETVSTVYLIGHSASKLLHVAYMSAGWKSVLTAFKTYSTLWLLAIGNVTYTAIYYIVVNTSMPKIEKMLECQLTNFINNEETPESMLDKICDMGKLSYGNIEHAQLLYVVINAVFGACLMYTTLSRPAIQAYSECWKRVTGAKDNKVSAIYASAVESSYESSFDKKSTGDGFEDGLESGRVHDGEEMKDGE